MTIRPMLQEDLAAIKAIDQTAFPPEEQYDDPMYELMLLGGLSRVVMHDGSVVGYAFVQLNPHTRIRSMAVHESYRHRGYAKALIGSIIEEAKYEVDLLVDDANEPAITLYESVGFARGEICPTVPPKRRMVLKLRPGDVPRGGGGTSKTETSCGTIFRFMP